MSDQSGENRFFRGSPWRTVIRLVIASVIVGAIFSFLGLGVIEFWEGIFDTVKDLVSALGENLSEIVVNLVTYFIIGAAVVVPIWFVMRLLRSRRR